MRVEKKILGHLPFVYAVTAWPSAEGLHLLATTELYGQWHHFAPPDYCMVVASHKPGGVLGLVPLAPAGTGLLAIEQAYPIYHSDHSCITYARPGATPQSLWTKARVVDLPFLHRLTLMTVAARSFLIAATLTGPKEEQEDWSRPGAVYASAFDPQRPTEVNFRPILQGIARNHGLTIGTFNGETTLLIGGIQGLFALRPNPADPAGEWLTTRLLAHDVSDAAVFDLDGDGRDEVVTIEPFHGNVVTLYRQAADGTLVPAQRWDAAFGHVVWAGMIRGRRCLLLGNRAGRRDLRLLIFAGDGTLQHETQVLDQNTGPANVAVVHEIGRDLIFSANHGLGEIALYEITD